MKKHKGQMLIIIVMLLVSILITSYSFVNSRLTANKKYVITSGLLELALEEKNGITLSNALPVYDEVGMLSDAYNFTLKNNSEFTLKYELSLVDETSGEDLLSYEDIRYGLTKNGTTSFGNISEIDNMIIDVGAIGSTKTIEYNLRLWIDNTVTDENRVNGKSRSFRVSVRTAKSDDDILLAATLDGEPVVEFPTREDNYGIESIICNNDVSASFNPTTWSVTVDGVQKSNTSCTVNFSSTKTVDETSDAITMSKSDLYAFYKGSFASTATSSEVLSGKTVYLNGTSTTGTMPNNGAISKTITPSASTQTYTIPKGYHDGTGKVTVPATTLAATSLSGSFSRSISGVGTAQVIVKFNPPFTTAPTVTYTLTENGHISLQSMTVTAGGALFVLYHSKGTDEHSGTIQWTAVAK